MLKYPSLHVSKDLDEVGQPTQIFDVESQDLHAPKGPAYRPDQIKTKGTKSHYPEPIDRSPGRVAGNSRRIGDASEETQDKVIDAVRLAAQKGGLTPRQTAIALSIVRAESGFNPDAAAGPSSAAGIVQFIDGTGTLYGRSVDDRFDLTNNATAFIKMFKDEQERADKLSADKRFDRFSDADKIYAFHHEGLGKKANDIYNYLSNNMPAGKEGYKPAQKQNINTYADKAEKLLINELLQKLDTLPKLDPFPKPEQPLPRQEEVPLTPHKTIEGHQAALPYRFLPKEVQQSLMQESDLSKMGLHLRPDAEGTLVSVKGPHGEKQKVLYNVNTDLVGLDGAGQQQAVQMARQWHINIAYQQRQSLDNDRSSDGPDR